jgi:hypothetical protein
MIAGIRVAIVAAAVVQVGTNPIRLGDVARGLSDRDVTAVMQVAQAEACREKPWLLNGPRGMMPDLQFIEAYCPPETSTAALRRGVLVSLMRDGTTAPWRLSDSRTTAYAQVAVPDREFNQVAADDDIDRPFRVVGEISDAELVSVARFIRSGAVRAIPAGSKAIEGKWPITGVVRRADGTVDISLRRDDLSGQRVTVRRDGQGWTVLKVGFVIA